MSDNVNNVKHYEDGKINTIDFIEDKKLDFHLGNAVKYCVRAGKKDPSKTIEDLQKAIWYIQRKISTFVIDPPKYYKCVNCGSLTHFRDSICDGCINLKT